MNWIPDVFRGRRLRLEVSDDVTAHLQERVDELVETGMPEPEARQQARREFGNTTLITERSREPWTWIWLEQTSQDVRYALRMMLRSPGFTAVAVLSLALGIGANTAIFSVVDALMLKMLPVRNPQQLVNFVPGDYPYLSYPMFTQFRDRTEVFSGMSAICSLDRSNVTIDGPGGGLDPRQLRLALVSGNYFSMLGVEPVIGRTFTADDDRHAGAHPVAVISYGYWRRRFGLSSGVVGRTLTMNGTTYNILGVTPPRFSGDTIGEPTDLWIPIMMQDQVMQERPGLLNNPNPPWVRILARMKPEVSSKQAHANVLVVFRQMLRERAGDNPTPQALHNIENRQLDLDPGAKGYAPERRNFAKPLAILMVVVGLVLLIACANVANLLLARAAARRREMSVRLALGAGRSRIVRQLLTESLLLAVIAGAAGIAFAIWGTHALGKMHPLAVGLDLRPDARLLTFTAALCLLTGILFGLAPASRSSNVAPSAGIKGNSTGAPGGFGLGKMLVIAQVALSLVLLIGAGLFVRTLSNLKSQDLGFDREHTLMIWTAPSQTGRRGAPVADLYRTVQERISALPGVVSASPSDSGLLRGGGGSPVKVPGYVPKSTDEFFVPWKLVAPQFFDTVGMRLIGGRDFTALDSEKAPRVAIVNETMALKYFGRADVTGSRFGMRRDRGDEITIVGVVKDAKNNNPRDKYESMIYIPYRQDLSHLYDMCVAVRTAGNIPGLTARIREELRSIDPRLPILSIDTIEQDVDKTLVQERLIAWVSGFFGAVAVLLACIGLYGVMSYVAARKTNEIGIRLALGATRFEVLRMGLRESMLLVAAGIAIGIPATIGATRLATSLLFGVSAADPMTIGLATLLLILVALFAGFLPARRASKVDPMVALRYE
jgi:predicted permease